MNKEYVLRKNEEIQKLVAKKKSVGNKYYAIYYNFTKDKAGIAFSASKKVGNAVERNYQKRVVKEIVRPLLKELCNLELLIVIKKASINLSFDIKKQEIEGLLKKIIKEKENDKN